MSTTLKNAEIELSKQINDYWAGTTTSAGATTGMTLVDTDLKAKLNDWVQTGEAYDEITSGTYDTEERQILGLDNSNGTLSVKAHGGQIATSVTYRVHRLFSASDKRTALIYAARHGFPHIFKEIWDESLVSGNWLKDGSFERWTSTTNLTDWTETTLTATQTSTAGLFKHGSYSATLSGSAGTLAQTITNNEDLKRLAGESVTFSLQAKASAASSVRISIYDGTTYTYSSYNDQVTGWTADNDPLEVTATIQDHPGAVTFTIHYVSGDVYVDDARVISGDRSRIYIDHLSLARNRPHQVWIEPSNYSQQEEWNRVRDYKVDKDGYLYLPTHYSSDYRLRIRGIGYLDFLASGVSSTAWTATIGINSPQLDILVADAAMYLYGTMLMPNFDTGTNKTFTNAYGYWQMRLRDAIDKYAMLAPAPTTHYGV